MSTRIRLIVVGAALAALSLFGAGSALAGDGSSTSGSVGNVQPVQEQPAQPAPDYDCPNKGGADEDVSQQV